MVPLPLPKNSRPPTTDGCAKTVAAFAKPNAHLTFNFGTSSARIPAAAVDCMRLLIRSVLHPFQPFRLASGAALAGHALVLAGSTEVDAVLGARKSATACRSAV